MKCAKIYPIAQTYKSIKKILEMKGNLFLKVKEHKEKTSLVFIDILNFLGHKPYSMQTLSHVCLPLFDFLVYVIHFWMEV
jgi:hypothetical protein